jgi:dTMP kinase
VPATLTAARLAARDGDHADRIGGRPAEYHARVAAAFARFAEAEPARFARINGNARRGGAWRGDGRHRRAAVTALL